MRYAQASAAADAGDWEQAVAGYSMVAEADSAYRDTKARLAQARQQHQLATLLAEAHRLHRTGQWAAVIKVGERLQAIDPDVADPGGLITAARAELAAEQQAAKLAADYHTALRLFDAGRWEEAVEALELVSRLDSAYQDAPALLDRARRELGQVPAALSEEEVRREAEEQDRPRAEEQAWPEQEARRQAEQRGDTPHPRGTWILICGILGIFIMPETTRLAQTIQTWWPAILVALTEDASNARTEGFNRIIKQTKRVGCGYRNMINYQRRILSHIAVTRPQKSAA